MRSYQEDRDWSDRFIPAIKQIACRVRGVKYQGQYDGQFTIRSRRDSGARTELDKILYGYGDWMFYGFHDKEDTILKWYLIDLHVFRWNWVMFRDWIKSEEKPNGDGTYFRAFWMDSFPDLPPLLISEGF
jgi:hypothetical protein